jgi:N-acetyltransferase 10
VSQQFQDEDFASLSGARVVRIATNPDYVGMGYGSKALELLTDFYDGKFASLSEDADMTTEDSMVRVTDAELDNANLLEDNIKVRDISKMPPLFAKLSEKKPAALDYVGVSYGLTKDLLKFWKRAQFAPVYLRQTANDLTGEHTCVMLRPLDTGADKSWLGAFARDFHRRFLSLLSYKFREFPSVLALIIHEAANAGAKLDDIEVPTLTKADLDNLLTPFDLKRLESYASNLLDYHVILDLMPTLANAYFSDRLRDGVKLPGAQQSVLLSIGLQHKDLDEVSKELTITSSQLLGMLVKIMKKITTHFSTLVSSAIEEQMPKQQIGVSRENASGAHDDEQVDTRFVPLTTDLDEELDEGGDEALAEIKKKQRELIDSLPLDQ